MFGTLLCHSPWIINHIYDPFMLKKKELRPESEEDHYLLLVEGGVLLTCVYRILCTQHPPPQPRKETFFPTTYYQEVMSLPKNMQVLPIKTEL